MLWVQPSRAMGMHLSKQPLAHLFEDDENVTLCGRRRNTWRMVQEQETIGEYNLCKVCEKIAKLYKLEIPPK